MSDVNLENIVSSEAENENKSKNLLFTIIALSFVAVLAFGINHYMGSESDRKHTSALYDFSKTDLEAFTSSKIKAPELVTKLKALFEKVDGHNGFVPIALSSVNLLDERGFSKEALELTTLVYNEYHGKNPYLHFFSATHHAKLLEELCYYEKAIETLGKLSKSESKIMEGKIFLDLGRLYKLSDKLGQAKTYFQYVIDLNAGDEFEKMAKLYLQGI